MSAVADGGGSPGAARRRGVVLAGLGLVALLLHGSLLHALRAPPDLTTVTGVSLGALQLRVIDARPPLPEEPPGDIRATQAPTAQAAPTPPRARPAAQRKPAPATAGAPKRQDVGATSAVEPPRSLAAQSTDLAPSATAGDPVVRELPHYPTRIPPAVTLHYLTRRGAREGVATLSWLPDGARYEARLEARLPGSPTTVQLSRGGFDESGVAPERFTDHREHGGTQAANFRREVGKISFSGSSASFPLWAGSQDRLSWIVQLAAVVSADPQHLQPGGVVVIQVVDARGDARPWTFRFLGFEPLGSGPDPDAAARFQREPDRLYDTHVDLWLDPQRHHLPARVQFRAGLQGESIEWQLQEPASRP